MNPREKNIELFQLHNIDQHYIEQYYSRYPSVASAPYGEQIRSLLQRGMDAPYLISQHMQDLGRQSLLALGECQHTQLQWAFERGKLLKYPTEWATEILLAQLSRLSPTILIITDVMKYDSRFIKMMSPKPEVVIGWLYEHTPPTIDLSLFDTVFVTNPVLESLARSSGAPRTNMFYPAFSPELTAFTPSQDPVYDFSLFAEWNSDNSLTQELIATLLELMKRKGSPLRHGIFLKGHEYAPAEIKKETQPYPREIAEYFQIMLDSHAVVHTEPDYTSHWISGRGVIETTGLGKLAFVPNAENLPSLFEPDLEVIPYNNAHDLLTNLERIQGDPTLIDIARAGKLRCFSAHSMMARLCQLDTILVDFFPDDPPEDEVIEEPHVSTIKFFDPELLAALMGEETISPESATHAALKSEEEQLLEDTSTIELSLPLTHEEPNEASLHHPVDSLPECDEREEKIETPQSISHVTQNTVIVDEEEEDLLSVLRRLQEQESSEEHNSDEASDSAELPDPEAAISFPKTASSPAQETEFTKDTPATSDSDELFEDQRREELDPFLAELMNSSLSEEETISVVVEKFFTIPKKTRYQALSHLAAHGGEATSDASMRAIEFLEHSSEHSAYLSLCKVLYSHEDMPVVAEQHELPNAYSADEMPTAVISLDSLSEEVTEKEQDSLQIRFHPIPPEFADPVKEHHVAKKQIIELIDNAVLDLSRDNPHGALRGVLKAKSMGIHVRDMDYVRALCILRLDEKFSLVGARESLREELRHFQDNHLAMELLSKVQAEIRDFMPEQADQEFVNLYYHIREFSMASAAHLCSLYRHAKDICERDVPGDFVECGVGAGGSAAILSYVCDRFSKRPRKLFLLDTFEGLPATTAYDHQDGVPAEGLGWGKGTSSASEEHVIGLCRELQTDGILQIEKGDINYSLPEVIPRIDSLAFVHLDLWWFSSTLVCLEQLYPLLNQQSLIGISQNGGWFGPDGAAETFDTSREPDFNIWDQRGQIVKTLYTWIRKW